MPSRNSLPSSPGVLTRGMMPDHYWGVSGPNADTLLQSARGPAVTSVCPGIDNGRFRRKANIFRRWREMAQPRMTQRPKANILAWRES